MIREFILNVASRPEMKRPNLRKTRSGDVNLHIWRTGENYPLQKEDIYLAEWNNLYFSVLAQPPVSEVLYHDVRRPFPFDDAQFDAVYAFHIIEHLTPGEGKGFLSELHRILKPGGMLRLSTPDLEDIARNYLKRLETCLGNPSEKNRLLFLWAQLEFYDQMVRLNSGGEMLENVLAGNFDQDYAFERYGDVFEEFQPGNWGALAKQRQQKMASKVQAHVPKRSLLQKIIRRGRWWLYRRKQQPALRQLNGDPRLTMEINKWTYDRLSLRQALEQSGFGDYKVKSFKDSDIRDWDRFDLDRSNHGDHPIEPSLYVEAMKFNPDKR